jgi:uncharacterized protein YciI
MFIVLLKFSENRPKASEFMQAHNEWIKQGLDDGVFLLVGSLQAGAGGAVLAHQTSLQDLQVRVDQDPFVIQDVVKPEILEISASKADERLRFLLKSP